MIPELNLSSEEIIECEIRKFWKTTYPQEVIAFFYQKYKHEKEWEWCAEFATPESSDNYVTVYFENDFCEGQDCVKELTIVPLSEITEYYAFHVLGKPAESETKE